MTEILCVTLNTALDVTCTADRVLLDEVNRIEHTHAHAGGKGVNVARLLQGWGRPVSVLGFAGGLVGAEISASLDDVGLAHHLVPCAEDSRRTVTVVDRAEGTTTGFYEAGPTITAAEWERFVAAYDADLATARLVVLAGSLPPGVPADAYRRLTAAARARDLPVVVDAHGKAMLHALAAGPSVVTPNEAELAEAVDLRRPVPLDVTADAARRLLADGAGRVVATLGARGLVGASPEGCWHVATPPVEGNPTGAGDAAVGVIADDALADRPWPETLCRAAATAAAAVRSPVAGRVDPADVADLMEHVEVREL